MGIFDTFSSWFGDSSSGLGAIEGDYPSLIPDPGPSLGLDLGDSFGSSFSSGGDSGGFLSGIGSALSQGPVLGAALTAGAGLIKETMALDKEKQAEKQKLEDEKFKYLLELAKLKYGPQSGGGGGGGAAARNAEIISALNTGTNQQVNALHNFAQLYGAAVK